MALPPVQPTLISLPDASIRVLQDDGTLAIPWRRFIQQLFAASGGSASSIAAILAELATLAAAVAQAQQDATTALGDASAAQDDADDALQLAIIASGEDQAAGIPSAIEALLFLALSQAGEALAAATPLEVLDDGVEVEANTQSLNFTGATVAVSTDGMGHVTVQVAGMLPLVNGDLPGPSPIADGVGQFIGVPLF